MGDLKLSLLLVQISPTNRISVHYLGSHGIMRVPAIIINGKKRKTRKRTKITSDQLNIFAAVFV